MKKSRNTSEDAAELRLRAEARLRAAATKGTQARTEADTQRLVHELQVHQIELEMQNEELRQSRAEAEAGFERYTDLYDFAPMGYLTLGRDGAIREMNLTGACLLGIERARLVGRRFGVLVAEPDRAGFKAFLEKVFASQTKEVCEVALLKQGKEPLNVQITATVSQDRKNCSVLMVDITERKQGEEVLRTLSSRQEAILAAVPEIIMEVDCHKVYTWANRAGVEFFGEDVIGKEAAWYFEGEQDTYGTVQPLFNGDEKVFYVESWQRRRDGQKRLLAWWCRVLKDEQGTMTGALSTARDITERKQAEETLRESELKYRRLYNSMVEAFASTDMSGRIQETNRAFQILLGYSEEELKQLNYTDLTPEKWHALESSILNNQIIPRGYSDVFEKEYRKKDGTIFPVELRTFLFRETSGQPIGMWAIIRDVTERKGAEKKLEEWRQLMDFIIRHDPNSIAVYDENLRYIFVSERYLHDYKVKDRNIIGKHHYEVFPEMPERWKQVHQRVLAGAVERAEEDRFERLDGSVDYNRWECRPWYRLDGSVGGIITYTEVITERKQAEEALRESEARFRTLVERAPDAIFVQSAGRFVYLNSAACRLFGASRPEDLLGKDFMEMIVPEYSEKIRERIRLQLETGESAAPMEQKYLRLDGSQVAVETTAVPIRYEGEDAHIVFIRDITARKQAEESLRESEAKFRQIVENTNEGIWTIDGQHRVVFVNQRMASMLGYSPEEMIGRGADSFIFAEDLQDHNEKMKRRQRGESAAYERRLLCKDGIAVWTIVSASPIMDAEGRFAGSYGMFTDITERKQAEEHLRLSQARYRTLVENIPQRVLLKDRELNYISINQPYARAYGLNSEDVIGKSDYDIHPRNLADKFRQEDRLVLETGESREFQEENVEDGKKRFLHKVKVPVRDKTGKITGVLSAISDITERLQLEEQFRHSQKMEAVGRLAGGVAHDFNNLLTVIGGHTEIALTRIDKSNPLRDNLQEVKIAADRASSLTRQLLAFSRRQVMEIKVLNLNTVIRDTEKMFRRLLGEDIEVITQPSENLGLVKADPGQIEQVLTNLAVNARDAMAESGRLVIATDNLEIADADDPTHAGLAPGRYVRISVSDTGHGMNPEVMSKIFEPFFTTKDQGKGTGLGLSTVFGIVKQSGGEIRVHSEPEKGTTFVIMLPRVEEAETVIGKKDLKEPPRGTETVLIIEDEKSVLKMAAQLLKNQGYQILEAPGSEDAMRVFEEHSGPIDLVLTDVVMPVCRGPALVERLKQLRDNFKVLYMSGYTDGGVGDLYVLRRGDNFIQKPFTLESLAGKVRSVLDGE